MLSPSAPSSTSSAPPCGLTRAELDKYNVCTPLSPCLAVCPDGKTICGAPYSAHTSGK